MPTTGDRKPHRQWDRAILVVSTILASWLAMQMVHEFGHVAGAWVTGGRVARVALDPLGFSRTDLSSNPRPLAVAWAGSVLGVLLPLALGLFVALIRMPGAFVMRFFAGFCLVANGLYLGLGAFDRVGDCGDLVRNGAAVWQLWLFGAAAVPGGLALWNGQAKNFGFGIDGLPVSRRLLIAVVLFLVGLAAVGFLARAGNT